ncbi:MAG: hypothetical protein ABIM99_02950 [Candidatus Dojkabacteria bacterium]
MDNFNDQYKEELTLLQQEGVAKLNQLGFENIDVEKLLRLSDLHTGKRHLTLKDVHPLALVVINEFSQKVLSETGIEFLISPTGFSMGNWLLVEALNPKLKNIDYYTTDVDTFSLLFSDKSQIELQLPKLQEIENRERIPPFCTTFSPVKNSFNQENFDLDRVVDPEFGPSEVLRRIIFRSDQLRMLEQLYPERTANIREKFELKLRDAANKSLALNPNYKSEFLDFHNISEFNGISVEQLDLDEIFVLISKIEQTLLSPIKLKHIQRSVRDLETNPISSFNVEKYNLVLRALRDNFGITVNLV